jgi:hypothetical protein
MPNKYRIYLCSGSSEESWTLDRLLGWMNELPDGWEIRDGFRQHRPKVVNSMIFCRVMIAEDSDSDQPYAPFIVQIPLIRGDIVIFTSIGILEHWNTRPFGEGNMKQFKYRQSLPIQRNATKAFVKGRLPCPGDANDINPLLVDFVFK